jgi:hypothetical protein
MLADATQGGISLSEAAAMPNSQRAATIEILKKIRERQSADVKKQKGG